MKLRTKCIIVGW